MHYIPKTQINNEALELILQDSLLVEISNFDNHQIVAIFIPKCKYCHLSMQRLASIFERHQLDHNLLKIIIVGNSKAVDFFQKETQIDSYPIQYYPNPVLVIKAIDRKFPAILFMEGKTVKKTVNYRGINEKLILDHLQ